MTEFVTSIKSIFDNLNPFNTGNLVIYFSWLVVYVFTLVAIWRSNSRLVRLLSFLVNQVFSIGVILSWTLTALLAYTYWIASLGAVVITLILSWWVFRTSSPKDPVDEKEEGERKEPALIGGHDG
jgi:hypothetical protein